MALPNIFTATVTEKVISRIEALHTESQPAWGKMNVAQMLAHCCVTYELVYTDKHPKPGPFAKFIVKLLAKNQVVSEKPYRKNSMTAPQFIITDEREFVKEKERLIEYINQTRDLGEHYFDGRESHSFGKLDITRWNNMFYKHLDHHLTQFGA